MRSIFTIPKVKTILLFTLFTVFLPNNSFGQFTNDKLIDGDIIDIEKSNSWSVGAGLSNFIMHGDLRSISLDDNNNFWNFGVYGSLEKMFNPLLGLELKVLYSKISGGIKNFSDYSILFAGNTDVKEEMKFEGNSYGAELNLIISLTNLHQSYANKYNVNFYLGTGYHSYNSALYTKLAEGSFEKILTADFGYDIEKKKKRRTNSFYLSGQFGLKRKINHRIDIEARTGIYFNYEDHLDAAISNKQDWETFFITSIGIAVKLGNNKKSTLWNEKKKNSNTFIFVDTDNDGVTDQLDIEPNTFPGAMVYGNGKAIDSDKDGLADYKDKCFLEYGVASNQGCPLKMDSIKNSLIALKDSCISKVNKIENNRCVKQKLTDITQLKKKIEFLAVNIYFDINSDAIKAISFPTIDKIISLMKKTPTITYIIEGHTDNINTDKYNLALSQRRASNLKKYMVQQGINSKRLQTKGYGESRPKFSNENPGTRQLNRRVEIKPLLSIDQRK